MASGMRVSSTDTDIQKRLIAEQVNLIDWTEAPLIKELGLNGERTKFKYNMTGSGFMEIIEDTMSPVSDALAVSLDTSTTTVQVTNADYFRVGHILELDNGTNTEIMWVSAKNGSALTVVRGTSVAATNTARSFTAADTIYIRGISVTEGANYTLGHTTTMTTPGNYVQEIQESVQDSWRNKSQPRYGVGDELDYHVGKLIGGNTEIGGRGEAGVLIRHLGRMAYHGVSAAASSSTGLPAMAGGFGSFISTNTTGSTTTELTRDTIHTQLRTIRDTYGGNPNMLVTGGWGMEKISAMYEGIIRTTRTEDRGGSVIRSIETPFGVLEVMYDQLCPAGQAWMIDTNKVGWVTVEPFDLYEKPSLGAYDVQMVWGMYSFMVANEKAHAKITFSTSL